MLVDPELAQRARKLLREPHETNGKGNMSTLLGTHELSSGVGFGLEPPLSPQVVHGPSAMTTAGPSSHVDLPSPPPALRPPESSAASEPAPTPEAAPTPVLPEPAQPQQAPPPPPAPVQQEPEPLMAPEPLEPVAPAPPPEPAPVELQPVTPAQQPEPEQDLAAVAPAELTPPAIAPELEPPATAPEPEAVEPEVVLPEPAQPAQSFEDDLAAPEQAAAPPPPPVELEVPEIAVLVAPPAPAPEEARPAAEAAPVEVPEVESLPAPVLEAPAVHEPTIEPVFDLAELAPRPGMFRVVVRLSGGDVVEVGEFRDFGTAMEGAQEVIDQFANANGSWPFYAGRFIRPDLIVSVDVVDGATS